MYRIAGTLPAKRWWASAMVFLTLALAASAQQSSQQVPAAWQPVEQALGRTGQMQADGVLRFSMPRSNLKVTIDGLDIQPGFALTSWAAFRKLGTATMVAGDLVLLEPEVPAVMSTILEGGMEASALHNHLLNETPALMYMHVRGHGDAVAMAKTLRDALAMTSTPEPGTPTVSLSQPFHLNPEPIGQILGYQGRMNNGVLQFSIPRSDQITESGNEVPPAMGVATAINFQPTGDGRAAVTGDFVLVASEVNPVMQALRQNNIVVTAVHNHMLEESPRLFFMHFWADGPPEMLAHGLRAALDKTASRR
jgi:Domain of Unknown Function (DUF1259)